LWFHVLLVIHPTRDQFTAEASWGYERKIKGYTVHQQEQFISEANGIRVSRLWCGRDDWWLVFVRQNDPVEKCLPVIAPAVADAAQKLKEHLVPVFEKIIQMHGKHSGQQVAGAEAKPTP
jgi:hypothetical protein